MFPSGARQAIAEAAAELAAVPPFAELSPVDRARLAAALEEVSYTPGEVIFAQGAAADALYILRKGRVERQAEGVALDQIDPPAVFGDLALLRGEPRATTLVAVTDCVVWRLPGDRFRRLLNWTPAIGATFAATVSSRLASRQREVAELAQQFQSVAEHLYAGLSPVDQHLLERLALLPDLDPRLLSRLPDHPDPLPLDDVLLIPRDGQESLSYPP